MKFTIEKKTAVSAISAVIPSIGKAIPILSNIAIKAAGDAVTFYASDKDITTSITVDAKVHEDGETTLPASKMLESIKNATADDIEVSEKSDKATIKSGKSKFTLGALSYAEFPILYGEHTSEFTASSKEIMNILDGTDYAMHTEESYHYLNGVFIHTVDNRLVGVATDGNRLAMATSNIECNFHGVIVPKKTVAILKKLAEKASDTTIYIGQNTIKAVIGNISIVSKLIDGTFPDYNRIIPKEYASQFKCSVADVIGAFERATVAADGKTNAVKVTAENGVLKFAATCADAMAQDEIDAEYSGDTFTFGVNARLIIDALRHVKTENAIVKFNAPGTPLLVLSENDNENKAVVCPMRVV